MLAAGEDIEAVHAVVEATSDVAEVQAGGGAGKALSTVTQKRRRALEHLVDLGVKALARWDSAAESKRAEIRNIVDQVSRRADLAEAWIEGTLRELPGDTFGFAAFEDRDLAARPDNGARRYATNPRRGESKPTPRTVAKAEQPAGPTAAERATRVREARRAIRDAGRDLAAAERKLESARRTLDDAEENMRGAQEVHDAARKRHEAATAQLEAAEGD